MKSLKPEILVVSCDKYKDIWPLYFKAFDKYWDDCKYDINLGNNFDDFDHKNVKTISVGKDLSYSSNLLKMLNEIKSEYIILWVEDLVLSNPVNNNLLKNIIEESISKDIDFLKLNDMYPYSYNSKNELIGPLPNLIKYQISIGVSLIKVSFLKEVINDGMSAWDIEYETSKKLEQKNYKIYALNKKIKCKPIQVRNILEKGKVIRNSEKIIREFNETNILKNRKLQTWKSYIYYRLFHVYFKLLTFLNLYRK